MIFFAAAETDVGIAKTTNQDSLCIKIAETPAGQIAMALVCDGMGGLEKGELASATVTRTFADWFEQELAAHMDDFHWEYVHEQWTHMIKSLNRTIADYGRYYGLSLGTTITAILLFENKYLIAHVGDSRAYEVTERLRQLTEDHSVVGREVKRGALTREEAERDPRRNVLTQCVGASRAVMPEVIQGALTPGAGYLLCSDGFRHEITELEIAEKIRPEALCTPAEMKQSLRELIDLAMARGEMDNISALLINVRA